MSSPTSWTLTGNSGTTPFTNFIGTSDSQPLVVQTNGQPCAYFDAGGNCQLGGNLQTAGNVAVYGTLSSLSTSAYRDGSSRIGYGPSSAALGIGTSSPRSIVEATANAAGALGPIFTLTNTGGNPNAAAAIDFNSYTPSTAGTYNPSARIEAVDAGNFSNDIIFLSNKPGTANSGLVENLRITSAGQLTIAGDIVLTGADCAEHFLVASSVVPEPGTVLVIDKEGFLCESTEPYDKRVAGVVSGAGNYRHGILLDGQPSDEPRVPLALTGKVYCKVDAQYGPVEVGDLLTTSPTPGHAMKATEAAKAFGSVIGKALRALDGGQGLVPILVALQ